MSKKVVTSVTSLFGWIMEQLLQREVIKEELLLGTANVR